MTSGPATIIYPVIQTGNKPVDELINKAIYDRILITDDDVKTSANKALDQMIANGLTDLDYEISFRNQKLLSINFFLMGCGAHCSSWREYLNFDLSNGDELQLKDILVAEKIDSFSATALLDKQKYLADYLLEIPQQMDGDTTALSWVRDVVEGCNEEITLDNFSFTNSQLELHDPCGFPHAVQAWSPDYHLIYSLDKLSAWFTDRFKALLWNP